MASLWSTGRVRVNRSCVTSGHTRLDLLVLHPPLPDTEFSPQSFDLTHPFVLDRTWVHGVGHRKVEYHIMCHVDIRLRSIHSPASIGKGRNPVCPSSPPVFLRASGILPLALRCLGSSATHGSEYIAMLL